MTRPHAAGVRIGVDIGGTFTDLVSLSPDGAILTRKVPSTTDDYAHGIATALTDLFVANQLSAAAIDEIIHGTTIATNAILQHRGARTGLITTLGFRDVLELRRLRMPEMYNLLYEKPVPLVERRLRREVAERIGARGEIIQPLDEACVRAEAEILLHSGVESIAVCLINSYANSVHERRIGEILAELDSHVSVSLSCEVLAEVREYERTSTTVINAYVRPVVQEYLESLLHRLAGTGVHAPLLVMQSNGGILSVRSAMQRPVQIVESGPAAGVVAARRLARAAGVDNVIAFDMGGTTAKASLIEAGNLRITSEFEVGSSLSTHGLNLAGGGYAMKVPVVDISEVGAGGGSIISVDRGGSLQVGPRSAGATPGPACYALGGAEATITDANVVLGYLNPVFLAGGAVPLDAERAWTVVTEQLARPLGLGALEAAWAAHVVANAHMIGAIKSVSTQRGRDLRDFTLLAFGGCGPVHAAAMATQLEMRRVIVPPGPGLFSAFGLLWADHEHHATHTFFRDFSTLHLAELRAAVQAMEAEALAEMAMEGYPAEQVRLERSADLRYVGQGFELLVPMDGGELGPDSLDRLTTNFHQEHERAYGHHSDEAPMQFVNLRLTARGLRPADAPLPGSNSWHVSQRAAEEGARESYFGSHGILRTPVVGRPSIGATPRPGPLIIEEYDATIVVPPGCTARLDRAGNILLEVGEPA